MSGGYRYERVRRSARSVGYVEVGVSGRIWRRNPWRLHEVELTSPWENAMVYELLDLGEFVRADTEQVTCNNISADAFESRATVIRVVEQRRENHREE